MKFRAPAFRSKGSEFFSRDKKEAMNNTLIWLFAFMTALVMGVLPFGYFTILPQLLGIPDPLGIPMLLGFLVLVAGTSYLAALGTGTLAQSSNCGSIKDMKRVAASAAIGMAIEVGFVTVGLFAPMIGTIVSDYFLAESGAAVDKKPTDPLLKKQVDVAFWGAWGALYGILVASTQAATC